MTKYENDKTMGRVRAAWDEMAAGVLAVGEILAAQTALRLAGRLGHNVYAAGCRAKRYHLYEDCKRAVGAKSKLFGSQLLALLPRASLCPLCARRFVQDVLRELAAKREPSR